MLLLHHLIVPFDVASRRLQYLSRMSYKTIKTSFRAFPAMHAMSHKPQKFKINFCRTLFAVSNTTLDIKGMLLHHSEGI